MYPSRFFETSCFHCRTKEPPGANLHLSAFHPHARDSLHPTSLPPFLARAKSSSSSQSLFLSLFLTRILLEIAVRVLGTKSEGKGYPSHVGECGNSFNRLIILFKPVAPLAHSPSPLPYHPSTLQPSGLLAHFVCTDYEQSRERR